MKSIILWGLLLGASFLSETTWARPVKALRVESKNISVYGKANPEFTVFSLSAKVTARPQEEKKIGGDLYRLEAVSRDGQVLEWRVFNFSEMEIWARCNSGKPCPPLVSNTFLLNIKFDPKIDRVRLLKAGKILAEAGVNKEK